MLSLSIFYDLYDPSSASFLNLFSVFSNIQYTFYNKLMFSQNDHPVCGTRIQTHDLLILSIFL